MITSLCLLSTILSEDDLSEYGSGRMQMLLRTDLYTQCNSLMFSIYSCLCFVLICTEYQCILSGSQAGEHLQSLTRKFRSNKVAVPGLLLELEHIRPLSRVPIFFSQGSKASLCV